MHQVGANIVADVLEADGWLVYFFGAEVPHARILKVVREHNAAVLVISTTMLFCVPKVGRLIVDACSVFPNRGLRVLVGGGAFHAGPGLPHEIDAVGYPADLHTTVALLQSQDVIMTL